MLATIRDRAKGWIAWIIVGFITIPFALWGIGSYFENKKNPPVAEVNGDDISADTLQQALDSQRRALRETLGKNLDPAMLDSPQLREQVLEGLIRRMLLTQDVDQQGYRISNEQLNELVRSTPQFQRNGRFAPDLYERTLRNAGFRPGEFEDHLRQQNTVAQLRNGFVESAFVPHTEIARIARLLDQKRRFEYAVIDHNRFLGQVTVGDDEIEKYYRDNSDRYRVTEQVKIDYVMLTVRDLARDITPTEDEIRKAYAEASARYVEPEMRRARHILVKIDNPDDPKAVAAAESRARELVAKARGGADFAQLARENSADTLTAGKGGDLGLLPRGVLETAFDDVLFSMKPGAVSDPVRTSFGIHVIKLDAVQSEKRKELASVRGEIVADLRRRAAEAKFVERTETFSDLAYEHPDSLTPVAESLGLQVQHSGWFGRHGGDGIAANPKVVSAAFGDEVLKDGLNSHTIDLDNDSLVVLRVAEHRKPELRPLAEVRGAIEAQLRNGKAAAEAKRLGEKLVGELGGGTGWQSVLAAQGLKVETTPLLGRSGADNIPPQVVSAVFRLPRPAEGKGSFGGEDLGGKGYALLHLVEVVDGSGAGDPGAPKPLEQLVQRRQGQELFAVYEQGLRRQADITIAAPEKEKD